MGAALAGVSTSQRLSRCSYINHVIVFRKWAVQWHLEAEEELMQLPRDDQLALDHAIGKLAAVGPALPYPHQSAIKAGQGLRELRPRGGRSRWRALYDRRGDTFVIAAVAPEAKVDRRGFDRAVRTARRRLEE